MPYESNSDLPEGVRNVLPAAAQSIWRNAYNSAEESGYGEERRAKIAWGAVKNAGYKKNEETGKWVKAMRFEGDWGGLSFDEVWKAIIDEADKRWGSGDQSPQVYPYIADLYADEVVFEVADGFVRVSYKVEGGQVVLGDEEVAVRHESRWIPIQAGKDYWKRLASRLRELVSTDQWESVMREERAREGGMTPRKSSSDDVVSTIEAARRKGNWVILQTGGGDVIRVRSKTAGPKPLVNEHGWYRKEILRTGLWAEPAPGQDDSLRITLQHLRLVKEAFDAGAVEKVKVPIGHSFDPLDNAGYVRALQIEGAYDDPSEYALIAWIEFTDDEIKGKIDSGSIYGTSVYIEPNVVRPKDGQVFPMVLLHVALTNDPFIENMEPFLKSAAMSVPLAASKVYTLGGVAMGKEQVKGQHSVQDEQHIEPEEDQALVLARLQQSLTDRQVALEEQETQLQELRATVLSRERKQGIREVILALEGKGACDGVVLVKGRRHYPAVVAKVEQILFSLPLEQKPLVLSRNGQEESVLPMQLILEVINAIPADARMESVEREYVHLSGFSGEEDEVVPGTSEYDEAVDRLVQSELGLHGRSEE